MDVQGFDQEDIYRQMNRCVQSADLNGIIKRVSHAIVYGFTCKLICPFLSDIFCLLLKELPGCVGHAKMSRITHIFVETMREVCAIPQFSKQEFRSTLKTIMGLTEKFASLVNRQRDSEINLSLQKEYFKLINRFLSILSRTQSTGAQTRVENALKNEYLSLDGILTLLQFFFKVSLLDEEENGVAGIHQKLRNTAINALGVQDRVPRLIMFYHQLSQIQTCLLVYSDNIQIKDLSLQIIENMVDNIRKQILPKLNTKKLEGNNLLISLKKWNVIEQIFTILRSSPFLLCTSLPTATKSLISQTIHSIPFSSTQDDPNIPYLIRLHFIVYELSIPHSHFDGSDLSFLSEILGKYEGKKENVLREQIGNIFGMSEAERKPRMWICYYLLCLIIRKSEQKITRDVFSSLVFEQRLNAYKLFIYKYELCHANFLLHTMTDLNGYLQSHMQTIPLQTLQQIIDLMNLICALILGQSDCMVCMRCGEVVYSQICSICYGCPSLFAWRDIHNSYESSSKKQCMIYMRIGQELCDDEVLLRVATGDEEGYREIVGKIIQVRIS